MKKKIAIALLSCLLVACSFALHAQGRHNGGHDKGGRGPRAHKHQPGRVKRGPVVRAHRFHRRHVVIVRPRRPRTINVLPNGYVMMPHRGRKYYYHSGFYYAPFGNAYNLVPCPIGLRLTVLPVGYRRIMMAGMPHYYYQGTYYKEVAQNQYETVSPAVGTVVPELPEDNVEEVTIDDQVYYEYDKQLYKKVEADNSAQYEYAGVLED